MGRREMSLIDIDIGKQLLFMFLQLFDSNQRNVCGWQDVQRGADDHPHKQLALGEGPARDDGGRRNWVEATEGLRSRHVNWHHVLARNRITGEVSARARNR